MGHLSRTDSIDQVSIIRSWDPNFVNPWICTLRTKVWLRELRTRGHIAERSASKGSFGIRISVWAYEWTKQEYNFRFSGGMTSMGERKASKWGMEGKSNGHQSLADGVEIFYGGGRGVGEMKAPLGAGEFSLIYMLDFWVVGPPTLTTLILSLTLPPAKSVRCRIPQTTKCLGIN